jgi:regulator of sigma E protease
VAVVAESTKVGWLTTLHLLGILSVNLAILNILPIPGLDGGRALFIALETVIKRKTLQKVEGYFHAIGMYLLILLLLVITVADVRKLIIAGSLSGFLESVIK